MFDDDMRVFHSAAFNGTSENGSAVEVGRSLNSNLYLTLIAQNPETTEGVLDCKLYVSFDNGGTYPIEIAHCQIGTDAVGFCGQRSVPVQADFDWEHYTAASIQVRATVVDGDNDGGSAWGIVNAYLGVREPSFYGRAPGVAEDIFKD